MFFGYIDPGSGYSFLNLGAWALAFFLGALGSALLFLKKLPGLIKRHKKMVIWSGIILASGAVIGAFMIKPAEVFNKKIVILGMDALSPQIMEPLMEQGQLPNFLRLKESGSYRQMATTNPAQSPVAWAGIATGKNPGAHGVFDFIKREAGSYGLDLVWNDGANGQRREAIKAKKFWQYASDLKVPVTVLNHPGTYPPDKISGRMLSGMGVPDLLGTQGTFSFYTSLPQIDDDDTGGSVFRVSRSPVMALEFVGPKVKGLRGREQSVKVPFKLTLQNDKQAVAEYQGRKVDLAVGEWSGWNEIEFRVDALRKIKGIFKFYLVEIAPDIKLYVTPFNFDPRTPFVSISYPNDYSRELAGQLGLYATQGMPMDVWAVNEGRLTEGPFLQEAESILREKEGALFFELERVQRGLLFCYFESVDIIQHMFWRYLDPQHPQYVKDQVFKDEVARWYQRMDRILGAVLDRLGPQDTIIVLSDHGFGSFRRAAHVNSWLRVQGWQVLKGPEEEPGRELLADVDWTRTKAYAVGFGGVYLNLRGREKLGIVHHGEEAERLKSQIVDGLTRWLDEKGRQPVVKQVYRKEDIFHGPYLSEAPDLYIGFNAGYRASWQTAMGAAPGALIEDNLKKWSGDHLFDPSLVPGVIFTNRHIQSERPSVYDIAPTVLKMIGLDEGEIRKERFDGQPLF